MKVKNNFLLFSIFTLSLSAPHTSFSMYEKQDVVKKQKSQKNSQSSHSFSPPPLAFSHQANKPIKFSQKTQSLKNTEIPFLDLSVRNDILGGLVFEQLRNENKEFSKIFTLKNVSLKPRNPNCINLLESGFKDMKLLDRWKECWGLPYLFSNPPAKPHHFNSPDPTEISFEKIDFRIQEWPIISLEKIDEEKKIFHFKFCGSHFNLKASDVRAHSLSMDKTIFHIEGESELEITSASDEQPFCFSAEVLFKGSLQNPNAPFTLSKEGLDVSIRKESVKIEILKLGTLSQEIESERLKEAFIRTDPLSFLPVGTTFSSCPNPEDCRGLQPLDLLIQIYFENFLEFFLKDKLFPLIVEKINEEITRTVDFSQIMGKKDGDDKPLYLYLENTTKTSESKTDFHFYFSDQGKRLGTVIHTEGHLPKTEICKKQKNIADISASTSLSGLNHLASKLIQLKSGYNFCTKLEEDVIIPCDETIKDIKNYTLESFHFYTKNKTLFLKANLSVHVVIKGNDYGYEVTIPIEPFMDKTNSLRLYDDSKVIVKSRKSLGKSLLSAILNPINLIFPGSSLLLSVIRSAAVSTFTDRVLISNFVKSKTQSFDTDMEMSYLDILSDISLCAEDDMIFLSMSLKDFSI